MEVRVLGALEVLDDQQKHLTITGAKLRSLLALLALNAGRVVPAEQIVDALWGEDPPLGVRNGLQALVSKLRKTLGSVDLVVARGTGYVLDVPPESVDVGCFEQLMTAAREAADNGDPEHAVDLLVAADALWHGEALAEFAYDDFARASITRLGEERLRALETRLELELDLGRHRDVVAPLEALVAQHPLRERLRGQLMVALYRSGRQADALKVFQDGRHVLADELGLDPGPELRRLEAAVLAQDSSLDVSVAPTTARSRADDRRWNIPTPISPLVGRDDELRELTALLAERRLITLVGPGGVGKTRLALEVARAERELMTFGAVLVELAPLGDPSGVRAAIAAPLEASDPEQLAERIGDRQLLIVLDNCEHVIETAAEVVEDLLERCPHLYVLATSREALRIGGETIWPVPPLAATDAEALFIDRAQSSGGSFDLTDETQTLVRDICARLDGLPLAIELAAARTRAFPLPQLAARLDDRFRVLTGGSRTALPRQQTLRAVVDWSYDLLFDQQRRVFERISLIPGGCTLATAEVVCADDDLTPDDIEESLDALVDKSLVIAHPTPTGVRFTQLQTLAQYGREKLADSGAATRVRTRMAEHFAALCQGSLKAFAGENQRGWLLMLHDERDNLRAAVDWAIDTGDAEVALGIAGALGWPHWLTGRVPEGKRLLDDAFGADGPAADPTRALALFGRGFLSFLAGDPDGTDADFDEAAALFRALGDFDSLAIVLSFSSEVAGTRGDTIRAQQLRHDAASTYEQLPRTPFNEASLAFSRAMIALLDGDQPGCEACLRDAAVKYNAGDNHVMHAVCLELLSGIDTRHSNFERAAEELTLAIEVNEALGLSGYLGMGLARLSIVELALDHVDRAEAAMTRALELGHWLMDAPLVRAALSSRARIALRLGRIDDATRFADEALLAQQADLPGRGGRRNLAFDGPSGAAMAYAVLGFAAAINRDGVEAERLHREGLVQARSIREPRAIAIAVEGIAGAVAVQGDGARAARLLGYAEQLRDSTGAQPGDFERHDLEQVRNATMALLAPDDFVEAFEQGHQTELIALVG